MIQRSESERSRIRERRKEAPSVDVSHCEKKNTRSDGLFSGSSPSSSCGERPSDEKGVPRARQAARKANGIRCSHVEGRNEGVMCPRMLVARTVLGADDSRSDGVRRVPGGDYRLSRVVDRAEGPSWVASRPSPDPPHGVIKYSLKRGDVGEFSEVGSSEEGRTGAEDTGKRRQTPQEARPPVDCVRIVAIVALPRKEKRYRSWADPGHNAW